MELKDLKEEHYLRLIKAISEIIVKKGPSHTSMDYVASTLTCRSVHFMSHSGAKMT